MRILVTGGSGFIASYLAEALAKRGHSLVNLDLVPSPAKAPYVATIVGDVRNPRAVERALQGCDAVFHLAAAHHDYGISLETYFGVNQHGTATLCDAMKKQGIDSLCFYSSVAVYGENAAATNEDGNKNPSGPYGASKLEGERVCETWKRESTTRRLLVIRPTVVFGPRNFSNMYALMRQIHSRKYARIGNGKNRKSVCYVENLVAATVFLWERNRPDSSGSWNYVDKPDLTSAAIDNLIHVAFGRRPPRFSIPLAVALLAVAPLDLLGKFLGKNFPISALRIRKFCEIESIYDAQKIASTGFVPPVSLPEAISRTTEWYLSTGKAVSAVASIPPEKPAINFVEAS